MTAGYSVEGSDVQHRNLECTYLEDVPEENIIRVYGPPGHNGREWCDSCETGGPLP